MLLAPSRLRRAAEFEQVIRHGSRAGTDTVIAHVLLRGGQEPVRVGFVVGKAVGRATTRNRVRRRLRHVVRAMLPALPAAALVVIRALPAAAVAAPDRLRADVESSLRRAAVRAHRLAAPAGAAR